MRVSIIGAVALVCTIVAAGPVAAEPFRGVLERVDGSHLRVGGREYRLEQTTSLLDMGGHVVDLRELHPGVTLELELDDAGKLVLVRADVMR